MTEKSIDLMQVTLIILVQFLKQTSKECAPILGLFSLSNCADQQVTVTRYGLQINFRHLGSDELGSRPTNRLKFKVGWVFFLTSSR